MLQIKKYRQVVSLASGESQTLVELRKGMHLTERSERAAFEVSTHRCQLPLHQVDQRTALTSSLAKSLRAATQYMCCIHRQTCVRGAAGPSRPADDAVGDLAGPLAAGPVSGQARHGRIDRGYPSRHCTGKLPVGGAKAAFPRTTVTKACLPVVLAALPTLSWTRAPTRTVFRSTFRS
jgi:hypothetical protein